MALHMNAELINAVLGALANESRRKILDVLRAKPGCSVKDVCKSFGTSRIAVMKHLRVLEDANLLVSTKRGRTRQLYLNAVPIQMVYERWTAQYSPLWASNLADSASKPDPV